jgi:hypothetical protein
MSAAGADQTLMMWRRRPTASASASISQRSLVTIASARRKAPTTTDASTTSADLPRSSNAPASRAPALSRASTSQLPTSHARPRATPRCRRSAHSRGLPARAWLRPRRALPRRRLRGGRGCDAEINDAGGAGSARARTCRHDLHRVAISQAMHDPAGRVDYQYRLNIARTTELSGRYKHQGRIKNGFLHKRVFLRSLNRQRSLRRYSSLDWALEARLRVASIGTDGMRVDARLR